MSKHIILFLAANPLGTTELALGREARAIQEELERSGQRDKFEFVTRWAVQPPDLIREPRKLKPTVVHFSGHGEPAGSQGGLYFQGPDGQPQLVPAEVLRDAFGAAGASVKLVVLNGCYSDAQAAVLLAHVDCVVGMRGAIGDAAARGFAQGFYGALGDGESVASAFAHGCAGVSMVELDDRDRPQLRVRPGVDAARMILAADHARIHDRLLKVPDPLFEQIVFRAGIDRSWFSAPSVALAQRVVEVAQLAGADRDLCRRLATLLDQYAPWTCEPSQGADQADTAERVELTVSKRLNDEIKNDSREGSGKDTRNHTSRWGAALAALVGTFLIALLVYSAIVSPVAQQDAPLPPDAPQDAPLPQDAAPRPDAWRRPDPPPIPPPAPPLSCPSGMVLVSKYVGKVLVPKYCIDKTEVTVGAYAACVAANRCPPASHTVNANEGTDPRYLKFVNTLCNSDKMPSRMSIADRLKNPMNCVSWVEASKYCEWKDRRLPTEEEWEYAARGEGRTFPWGEAQPSAVLLNERLTGNLMECPPLSEPAWTKGVDFKFDKCGTTTPVDKHPKGESPFLALDMAGNVWEWTAPKDGSNPWALGGGWNTWKPEGARAGVRTEGNPTLRNVDIGFRCAWPRPKPDNSGPR